MKEQGRQFVDRGDGVCSLVVRAQAGDLAAFQALVVRFQDAAVGYAYARLGDFHLAEDAAQEAFVEAFRDLPALREPAAIGAWLRRIVLHRCDRVTRREHVRVVPLDALDLHASDAPGPQELAEAGELRDTVRAALRGLPEPERSVTTLFYVADYSQAEVAAFLGLSVPTVNNRLHAARKRLHRSMDTMVRNHLRRGRPSRDERFVANVLRTVAPDQEAHGAAIYDTLEAKTGGWARTQWREGRLAHSRFDWAASRIGLVDDRLVTIFGIYDLAMRIGTATVRTAGANLEFADPDHPDDDALRLTAAASIDAMRDQGYDLSIAFGSEPFFVGLGYTFGWRELLWFVRTRDLPAEGPSGELIQFDPVHREDLAALYNREHERLTGTTVRPTYLRNKEPGGLRGSLWRDAQGAPAGYVSAGPEAVRGWRNAAVVGRNHKGYETLLWHDESAGDPDERLRVLGMLARQAQAEEVAFSRLHYLSPLGKRLRQLRCRIEQEYRCYVVKIVNLATTFEKLAPELSRRLADSHLAGWSGKVLISSGSERVLLAFQRNGVRVTPASATTVSEHAIEGGPEIAQLIVGSESPGEVVEGTGMTLRGDAVRLAEVLFPAQYPQMDNQAL